MQPSTSSRPATIHLPPRAPLEGGASHALFHETAAGQLGARYRSILVERRQLASRERTGSWRAQALLNAKAERTLQADVLRLASRILGNEAPQEPQPGPRSTHRVSYSRGGLLTTSSSPPVSDPATVQRHTHRHTDTRGTVVATHFECVGTAEQSMARCSINARDEIHFHVHTFNDPAAAPAGGRAAAGRPMHLSVDPDLPPSHGPCMHDEYVLVHTESGLRVDVEASATRREGSSAPAGPRLLRPPVVD